MKAKLLLIALGVLSYWQVLRAQDQVIVTGRVTGVEDRESIPDVAR